MSARADLSPYMRTLSSDSDARETHDFYPTPPAVTRALLAVERFDGLVWEPACGAGDMVRPLEAAGCQVIASDLVDRGCGTTPIDFLRPEARRFGAGARHIVTNPPYALAQAFVETALARVSGKVAMFVKLQFLETRARRALFEARPPARVHIFSDRVPIWRGRLATAEDGGKAVAYCWLVWEPPHRGKPELGWISQAREGAEPPGGLFDSPVNRGPT